MDIEVRNNDLPGAMRDWNDRGGLVMVLDRLSRHAFEVLERNPSRAKEIGQVAASITDIRHLLMELSRLSDTTAGPCLQPSDCRGLADKYLELEGLVKQLRNDLAPSRGLVTGDGRR